jgi:hypothetical protein
MLILMLSPALTLEESLPTLHLHEGLTYTETRSGDFMPARDDCWLHLTSDFKRKQLKVAKFEANHLAHQNLRDSQRLLEVKRSPPAPPTGWYCKTHSESTYTALLSSPCQTPKIVNTIQGCSKASGYWVTVRAHFKIKTEVETQSRLLGIQHLHLKMILTANKACTQLTGNAP